MDVAATSSGFERDQEHHAAERRRAGAAMQLGRMDHGVDDQRAHKGDAGGQDAGEHREPGERDGKRLVGGPDQQQGAAAVFEQADESALECAAFRRPAAGGRCDGMVRQSGYFTRRRP